jgi:hypothetical protein
MSPAVTFLAAPPPGLEDPAANAITLLVDARAPRRIAGAYRVSDAVAGAPRPAARGLVVALVDEGGVETLMPFRDAVFYDDDESKSGGLRTGWFSIELPSDRPACFVHAFLGLAASNVVHA